MTKRKSASQRGRANRNKGKVYERDVAHALNRVYSHAKRGIGQARTGAERPDVIGTPFWIECGTGKSVQIPAKLRQALNDSSCSPDDTYSGAVAIVFTKTTRGENVVSMEREQFIDLLAELEELRAYARSANAKKQGRQAG